MSQYITVIKEWISNKRVKEYEKELIEFFKKGFMFTKVPERTYFGPSKTSISFIVGGIYLLAYVSSGNDKGIWMLQNKIHKDIDENIFEQRRVKSTINTEIELYWLHTKEIKNLSLINENKNIWDSYSIASEEIKKSKYWNFIRSDFIKEKYVLTEIWNYEKNNNFNINDLEFELNSKIDGIKKLNKNEFEKEKKLYSKKLEKREVKTYYYTRNPYIIVEVLNRANGRCELCKNKAPFLRSSDKTPYLEVHHIIPLSKGGTDDLENTIALCPNCHRMKHFG